jgi:hypothetical protein
MRQQRGSLVTPFRNPHGTTLDAKGDRDDVYDHNSCPYFSHPHSMGRDTIPLVFEEGEIGHVFHGPIKGNAAKINTTMRGK